MNFTNLADVCFDGEYDGELNPFKMLRDVHSQAEESLLECGISVMYVDDDTLSFYNDQMEEELGRWTKNKGQSYCPTFKPWPHIHALIQTIIVCYSAPVKVSKKYERRVRAAAYDKWGKGGI